MLNWAMAFFAVAFLGGILGISGVAVAAIPVAWILFALGLAMLLAFLVAGRRAPFPWTLRNLPGNSGPADSTEES